MKGADTECHLVHVTAGGLEPHVEGLRALEASIAYPAGDRTFRIDHGPTYHDFFSAMGDAHFAIARDGDAVVGTVAGVLKSARAGDRTLRTLYICDLKVASDRRGGRLSTRLLLFGLARILRTPALRRARLLYGAAMHGPRGDVTRSARGWSPIRLGSALARCSLYFAEPAELAELDVSECPPSPDANGGVDLSIGVRREPPGITSTRGKKDLRLDPSGSAWSLVHLTHAPHEWLPNLGVYLRECGRELVRRRHDGPACFSVDQRLSAHTAWLAARVFATPANCSIYGLDLTGLVRRASWVHLASSEI